jgi:hypothetical protein
LSCRPCSGEILSGVSRPRFDIVALFVLSLADRLHCTVRAVTAHALAENFSRSAEASFRHRPNRSRRKASIFHNERTRLCKATLMRDVLFSQEVGEQLPGSLQAQPALRGYRRHQSGVSHFLSEHKITLVLGVAQRLRLTSLSSRLVHGVGTRLCAASGRREYRRGLVQQAGAECTGSPRKVRLQQHSRLQFA